MDILPTILKVKKSKGLNGSKWAEFLGITKQNWSQFATKKREPTVAFLIRVANRCPEIQLDIYQYLQRRGGE